MAVHGRVNANNFRKTLGVLGMEVFSFLSGRMMGVMDSQQRGYVGLLIRLDHSGIISELFRRDGEWNCSRKTASEF